jgi:uncharacterized protein (TIGR01319 family)
MNKKGNYGLFIDFGSTFTKVIAIDLDDERVVGRAQSPSTVDTDITLGLNAVLDRIKKVQEKEPEYRYKLACSSAAGGLRMVTIGLVPDLTAEAAKRAALGAGAKVVGVYSYQLTKKELHELEAMAPDIVLLAGGTDGGDRETILHNAASLSRCNLHAPIVVAGNKVASDEIQAILASGQKEYVITGNVMPEIGVLEVDKARSIIREVFINRIIEAKGLKEAEQFVDGIFMPTPTAVLTAAKLLSQGTAKEEGLGELVVVDIGGATTDIHSIARGDPAEPNVVQKGLPEPFEKRTVEGDLGLRYNASSIIGAVGKEHFETELGNSNLDLDEAINQLSLFPDRLPESESERSLDTELARAAAGLAMERHAGTIQTTYGPEGQVFVQYGKDLRGVKNVVGTGGPLIFSPVSEKILKEMLYSEANPFSLKPRAPDFYLDERYLLYAIGLMSEVEADKALRVAKKYLRRL